jgi:hypothetical protein
VSWAGHDECMQPCGSEGQVLSTYCYFLTCEHWVFGTQFQIPTSLFVCLFFFFFSFFLSLGVKFCTIVNSFFWGEKLIQQRRFLGMFH